MTLDRTLLIRYLRQLGERGTRELFLEDLTAREALSALSAAGVQLTAESAETGLRSVPGAGLTTESTETTEKKILDSPPGPPTGDEGVGPDAGAAASSRSSRSLRLTNGVESSSELEVLRKEASTCTKCRLHEGRRNVVFGEGSARADVVVVGEAPGGKEDRTGRPFVGPAGKLLDLLLLSVGLPRDRVFICNVLKCRPPKNRDPKADEVESCSPYLHRQLELIAPRVLLAVGKFAAQKLSDSGASIGRLRGRVHEYRGVPVVASYHPAYLLRSPSRTRSTWEDFQLLRKVLDEQS